MKIKEIFTSILEERDPSKNYSKIDIWRKARNLPDLETDGDTDPNDSPYLDTNHKQTAYDAQLQGIKKPISKDQKNTQPNFTNKKIDQESDIWGKMSNFFKSAKKERGIELLSS